MTRILIVGGGGPIDLSLDSVTEAQKRRHGRRLEPAEPVDGAG